MLRIEKQKLHTVALWPDLLLKYINGTESDDSDSDFDGYIEQKEALTDLLQRDLLDDELAKLNSESSVLQSNSLASSSTTGISFLAPPTPMGKIILQTYKIILIIVVHPLVVTTPATAMPSTSTIATASLPTGKTTQYQ